MTSTNKFILAVSGRLTGKKGFGGYAMHDVEKSGVPT